GIGRGEPLEDLDGRRLPGAVRPEEAEAFLGLDGQVQARDRHHVVVALDEPGATDGGHDYSCFGLFLSGSGGSIACLRAASSCMWRLPTLSARARTFMLIPPPRPAMTDIVPATSAMVPML